MTPFVDSLLRKAYLLGRKDTIEYVKSHNIGGGTIYSISTRHLEALDSAIGEVQV